jgi:hypothetical protein
MSKRFTSTAKWRDGWFHRLSPNTKLVFLYLVDNCDQAGVWEPNFPVAEAEIGFAKAGVTVRWHEILRELNAPAEDLLREATDEPQPAMAVQRILLTKTGKWWIVHFCKFQYGVLRSKHPPHAPVLRSLRTHDLLETYSQLFPDGITQEARTKGAGQVSFPQARRLPTLEAIRQWPEAAGIEESDLQVFYHHYTALGWRQDNGKLPANFRALLGQWHAASKSRASTELSAEAVRTIQARLQEIEERIAQLNRQTYQPYPTAVPQIQPEALAEIARLQAQRSRLQTRIIDGNGGSGPPKP